MFIQMKRFLTQAKHLAAYLALSLCLSGSLSYIPPPLKGAGWSWGSSRHNFLSQEILTHCGGGEMWEEYELISTYQPQRNEEWSLKLCCSFSLLKKERASRCARDLLACQEHSLGLPQPPFLPLHWVNIQAIQFIYYSKFIIFFPLIYLFIRFFFPCADIQELK